MLTHAHKIWACDFLQTYDLFFRVLFVFVIIPITPIMLWQPCFNLSITHKWGPFVNKIPSGGNVLQT